MTMSASDGIRVGLRDRDGMARAMRRTPERVALCAVGAYDIIMAAVSVFVFTGWFRGESYALLERQGLLRDGMTNVSAVVYVAQIYGFVVAAIGVVSIIVAARGMRPGSVSRGVMAYVGACLALSLLTADVLGVIGYSLCLTVYCARNRAIRVAMRR